MSEKPQMKNLKMTITIKQNSLYILFIIIFLFGSLGPFARYRMVPSYILLVITATYYIYYHYKIQIVRAFIPWIIFFIYICGNVLVLNARVGLSYVLMLFLGLLIVPFPFSKNNLKSLFWMLQGGAFIFALFTFINKIYPNIVLDLFGSFIYEGQQKTIARDILQGGIPGIAGEASFNAFFMSYGIITAASKIAYKINLKQILYIAILMFAVTLTGKRSLLLIDLALILISIILGLRRQFHINKFQYFLLIFGFIVIDSPFLYSYINEVLTKGRNTVDLNNRQWFWGMALELFHSHPVFGSGINTYDFLYNARKQSTGYISFAGAHNSYIQLLAETGIVGICLFIIALLSTFVFTIRLQRNFSYYDYLPLYFSIAGQVIIFIYALTENPFYQPQQIIFYFILLSIIVGVYKKEINY